MYNKIGRGKVSQIIISLAALCLSGCLATVPKQSGFLNHYEGMQPKNGLDLTHISSGTDFSSYDSLYITPVDISHLAPARIQGTDRDKIIKDMQDQFESEMCYFFKTVTMGSVANHSPSEVLRLDLSVTELRPSTLTKNADATIEGRFVDTKTGQELATFVDREGGASQKVLVASQLYQTAIGSSFQKLTNLSLILKIWADEVGNLILENGDFEKAKS